MVENVDEGFSDWFKARIAYLPGDTWPEAWIVQKSAGCLGTISKLTSADPDALVDILEYGLQAGKHNEFYEIARNLGLEQKMCLQLFTTGVCQAHSEEFEGLSSQVANLLTHNG
jgi:hypothetical protein